MKKAIIYYSKTGNTESVVEKFKGFDVLKVEAKSDDPNQTNPELTNSPDVKTYNYLIFAAPVHGFQLAKIMKTYLKGLDDLTGKTIDIFVTHHFRFSWLGGKQALKQMKKIIEAKGGKIRNKTSINWKSGKKDEVIETMLEEYKVTGEKK